MTIDDSLTDLFDALSHVVSNNVTMRAKRTLDVLTEGVRRSAWREVAHQFSQLTACGFPLEFTFTSIDEDVRYTTEVCGAEVTEKDKLQHAERLLIRLQMGELPRRLKQSFAAIQHDGELRYGAWVGARHTAREDKFKFYVEVPRANSDVAERLAQDFLGHAPLLRSRLTPLRMIGYEPRSSRLEFYFCGDYMDAEELSSLMNRAGLRERESELFDFVRDVTMRLVPTLLPLSKFGFSLSVASDADGEANASTILSIFFIARSLFGSDASIRRRILEASERMNFNFDFYAKLSEGVLAANTRLKQTRHGMIGFTVAARAAPCLHIGLCPLKVSNICSFDAFKINNNASPRAVNFNESIITR